MRTIAYYVQIFLGAFGAICSVDVELTYSHHTEYMHIYTVHMNTT